jgi:hypothetical protein
MKDGLAELKNNMLHKEKSIFGFTPSFYKSLLFVIIGLKCNMKNTNWHLASEIYVMMSNHLKCPSVLHIYSTISSLWRNQFQPLVFNWPQWVYILKRYFNLKNEDKNELK